jgi:hypothetical protein
MYINFQVIYIVNQLRPLINLYQANQTDRQTFLLTILLIKKTDQ